MKTLFDSSFILASIQLGFDALHEISSTVNAKVEPTMLKETVRELEKLSRRGEERQTGQPSTYVAEVFLGGRIPRRKRIS